MDSAACKLFIQEEDTEKYLIEYRGNLLEQIQNIDYACASIITNKLAILVVKGDKL